MKTFAHFHVHLEMWREKDLSDRKCFDTKVVQKTAELTFCGLHKVHSFR